MYIAKPRYYIQLLDIHVYSGKIMAILENYTGLYCYSVDTPLNTRTHTHSHTHTLTHTHSYTHTRAHTHSHTYTLNKNKCHVLHFGSNNSRHVYMLGKYNQTAVDSADDLGLLREATSSGRYDLHIQRAIKISYGALFLILHGLSSRRVTIMHKIFVSYIRPIIELVALLWFPHIVMQRQLQRVERVQHLFTRIISGFSSLSYEHRLSLLKMLTLYSRVKMSKLIILYMIIRNLININLHGTD